MSEIPEDVMRAVGELLGPPDERMNRSAYNALSLGIARAILAERLAERERAAKVACQEAYEALKPHFGYGRGTDSTHVRPYVSNAPRPAAFRAKSTFHSVGG